MRSRQSFPFGAIFPQLPCPDDSGHFRLQRIDFEHFEKLRTFPKNISLPTPAERIKAQNYLHALIIFESPAFKELEINEIAIFNYNEIDLKFRSAIRLDVQKLKVLSPTDIKLIFSTLEKGDKSMLESLIVSTGTDIPLN
jgi:hypothetical protein